MDFQVGDMFTVYIDDLGRDVRGQIICLDPFTVRSDPIGLMNEWVYARDDFEADVRDCRVVMHGKPRGATAPNPRVGIKSQAAMQREWNDELELACNRIVAAVEQERARLNDALDAMSFDHGAVELALYLMVRAAQRARKSVLSGDAPTLERTDTF